MTLYRSVATIGGLTLVSRALGFVRDLLFAAVLGAGMGADCFFVAFRLPNFFRALFAEGAFTAAFVPLYSRALADPDGAMAARRFAGEIATVLLLALLGFVGLVMVAMPWAMHVLAPGFVDEPPKFDLAVALTRLTFPYLVFISMVSLMGAMLNANHRFAAPAATPIVLNLVLIGALIGPARHFDPAYAQAAAVSLAGIAQFLWLALALGGQGLGLRLYWPRHKAAIKRFLALLGPATIGAGIYQINVFVGMILSSLLPAGSVSYLFYADRLNQLPLGVVGVAMSTALLPLLSRQLAQGEAAAARTTMNRALEGALILTLPAAAAMIVMPGPIIRVMFEHGAFTAADGAATAAALAAFASGLPAYVGTKVFTPGFHARVDTRTPVKIAGLAMLTNVALAGSLIWPLGHVGVALATALSAWLNVALLGLVLYRRGDFAPDATLRRRLSRLVPAVLLMAGALVGLNRLLEPVLNAGGLAAIGTLIAVLATGGGVFLAAALALGAITPADLMRLVPRRRGGRRGG